MIALEKDTQPSKIETHVIPHICNTYLSISNTYPCTLYIKHIPVYREREERGEGERERTEREREREREIWARFLSR